MELCQGRRGELDKLSYLSPERIELRYRLPLAEVVLNFFDQLKSRTQGYASLDYEPAGYMESDLVRVDILLQGEPVDAFSAVVHRDASYEYGRKMAERLKEFCQKVGLKTEDDPFDLTEKGKQILLTKRKEVESV